MLAELDCCDALLFVMSRVETLQIRGCLVEVGLRLLHRNRRLEPTKNEQRLCPALPLRWRRSKGQWRPQIEVVSRLEIRSRAHKRDVTPKPADNRVARIG